MKRLLPLTLALALLAGCAPTGAETPVETAPVETAVPTATPRPGPAVYTDDSKLTPHEKARPVAQFTRRHAEVTDTLIPADDYGPLVPFPGAVVTRPAEDGWGWMEDHHLYGLMTLEGEVVVDPVFSAASAPSMWDGRSGQSRQLDCLILQKVVKDENGEPVDVAALCARDGSWCTGFDYSYDWEMLMGRTEENVIPLRRRGDPSRSLFSHDLAFLDVNTGEEVKTVDLSGVLERWPDAAWSLIYNLRYGERYALFSDDTNHYLFDSETGEVRVLEELLGLLSGELESPYGAPFYEGLCAVKTASGWGYIDGNGWVTDPIYEEAQPFENGRALVRDEQAGGWYTYIDHSGKVVYTLPDGGPIRDGEYLGYEAMGQRHYLDKNFQPIPLPEDFTAPMSYGDWFYQQLPAPSPTVPGGWAFWNVKTGVRWDFPGGWEFDYSLSGNYVLFHSRENTKDYALADLATGDLTELGRWSYLCFRQDELTGESYLQLSGFDGGESEWQRMDGSILYRSDKDWGWRASFWDGRVFLAGENAATLTDLATGELIFSWPLRPAAD